MTPPEALMMRAKALKLHGLLAHWEDIAASDWVAPLLAWEEHERARRGLERRLGNAHACWSSTRSAICPTPTAYDALAHPRRLVPQRGPSRLRVHRRPPGAHLARYGLRIQELCAREHITRHDRSHPDLFAPDGPLPF